MKSFLVLFVVNVVIGIHGACLNEETEASFLLETSRQSYPKTMSMQVRFQEETSQSSIADVTVSLFGLPLLTNMLEISAGMKLLNVNITIPPQIPDFLDLQVEFQMRVPIHGCATNILPKSKSLPKLDDFPTDVAKFLFERWIAQYNTYVTFALSNRKEYLKRLQIFRQNVFDIMKHNIFKKSSTFVKGINQFTVLTNEEFKKQYLNGLKENVIPTLEQQRSLKTIEDLYRSTPSFVDWEKNGFVTPVKDQGACGSCWAFAAIAAFESRFAIKFGRLTQFSEAQMICNTDKPCDGKNLIETHLWMKKYGVCRSLTGTLYSHDNCPVSYCTGNQKAYLTDFLLISLNPGSHHDNLRYYVSISPVVILVNVDHDFRAYSSGVLSWKFCMGNRPTEGYHAMTIVGYGVQNGIPVWKVKNSYGNSWGMHGYIYIKRNSNAECSSFEAAILPVL